MITDTSFYCSLTKRDNLYWTVLITGRLGGGQDVGHVWWDFVGGLFCGAVERFRNEKKMKMGKSVFDGALVATSVFSDVTVFQS